MPLIHSSSQPAFKTNVKTLMGEVGKSPHVQSPSQALAIAYAEKRRNRAAGGQLKPAGWQTRSEARGMMHSGPISSIVPGRTDRHNMNVASGSYVIPSDTVSHLGQNNSAAGHAVLNRMFSSGPYGIGGKLAHGPGAPKPPRMRKAGGVSDGDVGSPTPVITAGGEYVVPPHIVEAIGGGDVKRGHAILDAFVLHVRKQHIKTLTKLPAPAKD